MLVNFQCYFSITSLELFGIDRVGMQMVSVSLDVFLLLTKWSSVAAKGCVCFGEEGTVAVA